ELTERLEEAIAKGSILARRGHDQRLVHQISQYFQYAADRDDITTAHCLCRFERESACKHGESVENPPLLRAQQGVAPVDGRVQRPMSKRLRPAATGQQVEAVIQPRCDVSQR